MVFKRLLLILFFAYAIEGSPLTYSVTANSYYPSTQTEADAYAHGVFQFQLDTAATLIFSAWYAQTPHTALTRAEVMCTADRRAECFQDLHTSASTSSVYFNSIPDRGICDSSTLTPFPCSATLPAGKYQLVLVINDSTSVNAAMGYVVHPFSDTLTVNIEGVDTPEPASMALILLGFGFAGLVARRSRPWKPGRTPLHAPKGCRRFSEFLR